MSRCRLANGYDKKLSVKSANGRFSIGWRGILDCKDCGVEFDSKCATRRFCDKCKDKRCVCQECKGMKKIDNQFCGNVCAGRWKYRMIDKYKSNLLMGQHDKKWIEYSKQRVGENHPQWRGGISKDQEHKRFMKRKWAKDNPEKIRLNNKRQKINRRGNVYISKELIQRVYENNIKKYGTLTCELCFKNISFGEDSIEHKLPISRGGDSSINNLAIAHYVCNTKKNKKTMEEWFENKGIECQKK